VAVPGFDRKRLFIRRQPVNRQNLTQGSFQVEAVLSHQGQQGQGSGQRLGQGGQIKIGVAGDGRGVVVLGDAAYYGFIAQFAI